MHQLLFRLPTNNLEFLSGDFHDEVEKILIHCEENPDCEMEGILEEKGEFYEIDKS